MNGLRRCGGSLGNCVSDGSTVPKVPAVNPESRCGARGPLYQSSWRAFTAARSLSICAR